MQSPSYKRYLQNRQNEIDAKKLQEMKKLDLFNEKTFYRVFVRDMLEAKKEIVIYCPFISKFRSEFFKDTLLKLRHRNVAVFIFTRPLEEHEYLTRSEISSALKDYEDYGACIICLPGFIHQKAAIIDRTVLWEGSLNILSQRESHEMMRRTVDEDFAKQIMLHLGLNKKLAEGYKYQYERLYRSLVEKRQINFRVKGTFTIVLKFIRKTIFAIIFAIPKLIVLWLKCIKVIVSILS